MTAVTLYHNPRCSKSRATLALLEENDVEFNIVEYLKQPLTADALKLITTRLGITVREFVRTGEDIYKELNLDDEGVSDEALLNAMAAHPILMQRPVVVNGEKARIGRPPESVLEII